MFLDTRSIRRYLPLIALGVVLVIVSLTALILVLRGGGAPPPATPIGETTSTVPATDTLIPTTAGPPTATATPAVTPTLEPYEWQVQEGETLLFILQQLGYRDRSVIPEVLALNGLPSEDSLQSGTTLLVPRQTPTIGPTPAAGTTPQSTEDIAEEDYSGCSYDNRCPSPDGQFWVHEVNEGETIAELAARYDTTIDFIQQDNGIGEFISPGDILQIRILVSPTPTLTPTGGPDSTATPTPTLSPPLLIVPVEGSSIARSETVVLQWSPLRPLRPNQNYLVILTDVDTGSEIYREVTRSTTLRLPDDLQPPPGGSLRVRWQVVIVEGSSPTSPVVGGQGQPQTFTWGASP